MLGANDIMHMHNPPGFSFVTPLAKLLLKFTSQAQKTDSLRFVMIHDLWQ